MYREATLNCLSEKKTGGDALSPLLGSVSSPRRFSEDHRGGKSVGSSPDGTSPPASGKRRIRLPDDARRPRSTLSKARRDARAYTREKRTEISEEQAQRIKVALDFTLLLSLGESLPFSSDSTAVIARLMERLRQNTG